MADYKKPDFWTQKAKKEGYPARSVYKLEEIDKKFQIFRPIKGHQLRILDIGAAPGSWSLFVLRKFGTKCFLSAADLLPLSRDFDKGLIGCREAPALIKENFFFIQGDITEPDIKTSLLEKGPYTTIISDAAPNTSGNHTIDAARSFNLVEMVLNYAEETLPDGTFALIKGGNLVVKIFQGGDSADLLKRMKTMFETVKTFKPSACRENSVETYYAGLGKK